MTYENMKAFARNCHVCGIETMSDLMLVKTRLEKYFNSPITTDVLVFIVEMIARRELDRRLA